MLSCMIKNYLVFDFLILTDYLGAKDNILLKLII